MESIIPILWPKDGLVEAWSFSDQPEGSAREYKNVRWQDPTNGRLRGAQRSGMSKYLTSALKTPGTKAHGLTTFFVDNRQVTYSAIASGSETFTWSFDIDTEDEITNVKTDRQGNAYYLASPSQIVKRSADGDVLWRLPLPTEDTNHVSRALAVDDTDTIYSGISDGGDQKKARIYAFEQLENNKTKRLWTINSKAFVEDMVVVGGMLYTCQNDMERRLSWVRIYEFIETSNPELAKEWRVPHPVNSIAVKEGGAVIVACEPSGDTTNYMRFPDQRFSELGPDSVVWTPLQLANDDRRIWSWYLPDTIDQTDVATEFENGVEILRWRDFTRNLRHWGVRNDPDDIGPRLAIDGAPGKHAAVRFNKPDAAAPYQRLATDDSQSTSLSNAEEQRSAVPGYTDSMWALWIVCRLSTDGTDPKALFLADTDSARHVIWINATSSLGNIPTFSSGDIFWDTGGAVSGGSGTGGTVLQASFDDKPGTATDNPGKVAIICLVSDGSVSGSTQDGLFQVNGFPVDIVQTGTQINLTKNYLGTPPLIASLTQSTIADIFEIICLDRKSRATASQNVLTYDALEQSSTPVSQTINEMTLITGYLAHKYGLQFNLPNSSDSFPHPFGRTGSSPDFLAGPPNVDGDAVSTAQALANKSFGCVVKYSADGKIVWTANEMATGDGSRPGGFGYAVAVNSDGNIYSTGPFPTGGAGGQQHLRMIVDQGDTFSIDTADGAWSVSFSATEWNYKYGRLDVDEFDNVYVPVAGAGVLSLIRVYKKDGTLLHDKTGAGSQARACAVDRQIPDYRSDIDPKRAEHVIFGRRNGTINKLRLVAANQAAGPIRELYTMGVSGGDIVRFVGGGAVSTPTGGSGALDADARYVQSAVLYKRAYWTDGRQYRFYEPITNTVAEYKSLTAGKIPDRCALIESWRGRIVLARSADEPHNWFMSKKDEPTNWDYFPPVPNETQAVAGNNSAAGLCPDIINSLVPYSEDILVFGGDHSIWALVGDPAAGGRLELVSDITGMAFGRPWCKDPNGVLYFVGSRGGLFRWVPGGKPERTSLFRIERQLQEIDFSTYHVKLAWNYQDEGLHILQCPFGAGGAHVSHWFWEMKPEAFVEDTFGTSTHTNIQPTDVLVVDGDEFDDRVLLFGCEDGFVRKWDKDEKSDDVQTDGSTKIAIDELVTIFPVQANQGDVGSEAQFQGLSVVLGDRGDGCRYELFASDEPDSLGVSLRSGVLGPGRNPPKWDRVTGAYFGIRLRNAAIDEGFSFERAHIHAARAGIVRPRQVN